MTARILLADSNDRSREMLVKLLGIYGITQVEQLSDGALVLSSLQREIPELAIVDADLQNMDGLFVCEILRFLPRFHDVKVVLLGNSISQEQMKKSMQLSVHAFLERPVNAENVKSIVQLLKTQEDVARPELPSSINKLINALAGSAQKSLTLLFKSQARVLKVEALSDEYAAKKWDFISQVALKGQIQVQVAACATSASAKALSNVMPKGNENDLAAVIAQFLDTVLERALPDIRKVFTIQAEAKTRSSGTVSLLPGAQYQFAIHLRVGFDSAVLRKQLAIPLYVSVSLA